jgi:hypothetical protein
MGLNCVFLHIAGCPFENDKTSLPAGRVGYWRISRNVRATKACFCILRIEK